MGKRGRGVVVIVDPPRSCPSSPSGSPSAARLPVLLDGRRGTRSGSAAKASLSDVGGAGAAAGSTCGG